MKHLCKKHGSSLHFHVCRHVAEACRSSALLMPVLSEPSTRDLVCRECLTPDVQKLLQDLSFLNDNFFDHFDQLKLKIGYTPICTECLYENTGIDRRRDKR